MRRLVAFACIITLLPGCSYLKQSQRLDLSPFAEYTVTLASDIEYGMTKGSRIHYLMDYRADPMVVEHGQDWDEVRRLLRSVVAYSVEITTLGSSPLPEKQRNKEFAVFLDRLVRPVLHNHPRGIHITEVGLDSIIADVRSQKKFLGALGAAQPLIDEASRIAELIFDDTQDSLDEVAEHLRDRIEEDNANVIHVRKAIMAGQERLVKSITLLGQYRAGDTAVLPALLQNEPQLRAYLPEDRQPTFDEVQSAEDRLLFMMEKAVDFKEQFAPDMAYYRNQVLELDDIYSNAQLQLKKSRVTVMVWARAHRDLARGISDPARIDIFDITKKAVRTAL